MISDLASQGSVELLEVVACAIDALLIACLIIDEVVLVVVLVVPE